MSGDGRVRMGRPVAVKNKAPAPVQITAEQILREAMERVEAEPKPPKQKITDEAELDDYRLRKRKEFEDNIRRQQMNVGAWLKYAAWEASQNEFDRARSVYERGLNVDVRNPSLWLKYAEMEMKNRFINSARNIWDRAVQILPMHAAFWLRYTKMEEIVGNVAGCRQVFERWMEWQPDYPAWAAYVKFEERQKQPERARGIYERLLVCHPEIKNYLKFAKWEERQGRPDNARVLFERATNELEPEEAQDERLMIAFAEFETRHKEFERARAIFRYALDNLPKSQVENIFKLYTSFEKQYGSRDGVERVILAKRRFQYEEEITVNSHNYDVWFDYIRLEEMQGEQDRVRKVFERAVANVPLSQEKRFWKRYIYLWINFALYEELVAKDLTRTKDVYESCLKVIPHDLFTFSKVWVMYAKFELRQRNLTACRQILGTAIGKAPKEKLFKAYIELELQLGEIDRCRKLYERYLELMPENCNAWVGYAGLEASLNETTRARAIFELAVQQNTLDMPELLWKAYIDLEIGRKQFDRVRALYDRLLQRTQHVKVWISRAQFEASIHDYRRAREVFTKAEVEFKREDNAREERVLLLEAWLDFERNYGDAASVKAVQDRMPKRIKKKRLMKTETGEEAGWEEYYDYIFPDEERASGSALTILERARQWKLKMASAKQDDGPSAMDEDTSAVSAEPETEASSSTDGVSVSRKVSSGKMEVDPDD